MKNTTIEENHLGASVLQICSHINLHTGKVANLGIPTVPSFTNLVLIGIISFLITPTGFGNGLPKSYRHDTLYSTCCVLLKGYGMKTLYTVWQRT